MTTIPLPAVGASSRLVIEFPMALSPETVAHITHQLEGLPPGRPIVLEEGAKLKAIDAYGSGDGRPIHGARLMSFTKIASTITVADEYLIDMGLGTPEMIAADKARHDAAHAWFAALPWHVRVARRHVWPRWHEARSRAAHAVRALRGSECEDSW